MNKLLTLTPHAYIRYKQRIDKSKKEHQIANTLSQLVSTAKDSLPGNDGATIYYAKGLAIVVAADEESILTVYKKDRSCGTGIVDNIVRLVKNEIFKEERLFNRRKRLLLIEMYEAEIRKLKVFNPKTQASIQRKISAIKAEIAEVQLKLIEIDNAKAQFQVD